MGASTNSVVAQESAPARSTCRLAVASVLMGAAGFLPGLGLLTGVPAAFAGWSGRRRISRAEGALAGRELATLGMVLGVIGLLLSLGWVMLGVAIALASGPQVTGRVPSPMQDLTDAGNLKQIGVALRLYAGGHGGRYPADLGVLFDERYLTSGRLYVSPGSSRQIPASGNDVRAGGCDYTFLAAHRTTSSPDAAPLALVAAQVEQGFVVLFSDGSLKQVGSREFEELK